MLAILDSSTWLLIGMAIGTAIGIAVTYSAMVVISRDKKGGK